MKIDDSKVIEYLNGNDLSHYSDEWFFTDTRKYTAPPDDSKVRDGVCRQMAAKWSPRIKSRNV